MADVDEELDQQHGQGAGELEAPEVDVQDDGQGDLAEHSRTVDAMLQQAQQAGLGNTPQARSLKHVRRALRGTRAQIQAAEERGRQRALEEFAAGNEQAVNALRAQVQAEMQAANARERSLARLGIGPDSPVRSLFDGVQGDHKAYERQAALLRAAGVSWDSDPLLRQIGQQQVAQWTQAAQQNGGQVPLDPSAGVPAAVREDVVRRQVESMADAAAGGQTVEGRTALQRTLDDATMRPPASEDDRYDLAQKINAELDGLRHAQTGGPWG